MRGGRANGLRAIAIGAACVAAMIAHGCSSSSSAPGQGGEREDCYPNGTCNAGLTCASDVCVRLDGGGSEDGGVVATEDASNGADANPSDAAGPPLDGASGDAHEPTDAHETTDASDAAPSCAPAGQTLRLGSDGGVCGYAEALACGVDDAGPSGGSGPAGPCYLLLSECNRLCVGTVGPFADCFFEQCALDGSTSYTGPQTLVCDVHSMACPP